MPYETPLPFQVEMVGDIAVVRFAGWKIPMEVREPLFKLVDEQNHHRLLLDLSKVTYMSSNIIAIIVSLKKRVDAVGGTLKLCQMNADLVEILRHTHVDRILSIYPQEIDALAAF